MPGGTVTLSVSVTNTATLPVGYRWRRNGASISGALMILDEHMCFFTVTNADPAFTNYTVVCTNASRPIGFLSASAVLTFVTDTDLDGMTDEWEDRFDLDRHSAADRDADPDRDSMNNGDEYIAGTDPRDPLSYLKVQARLGGDGVSILFGAVSNRTYTLEYTDTLSGAPDSAYWSKLGDVPASGTNGTASLFDANGSTERYYRLVTPRQP